MPPSLEDRFRTTPSSPDVSSGERQRIKRFFSQSDEEPKKGAAGMRRRHFQSKAAQFIRKSVAGPDYEETEKHLTARHLHKILLKTSANNVSLMSVVAPPRCEHLNVHNEALFILVVIRSTS
jgi:hypothetical protein